MGTASPPAQRAASVRFGYVGGVVSVCMCVYFLLSQGLGPPCQFLVSGVSRPWEGAYPPRHKSARQAFRWESRSARHFPRQPSRATCVPDTECGWTSTDAASKRMALDVRVCGGDTFYFAHAVWSSLAVQESGLSICVAARVPSAASRAWLFRMGAGGQHPHTVLLFICTSTVRVQFVITSTCTQ